MSLSYFTMSNFIKKNQKKTNDSDLALEIDEKIDKTKFIGHFC